MRFRSSGSGSYVFIPANGSSFGDTAGHWAEEAISRMANGVNEYRYKPQHNVARAELAALFNRSICLLPIGNRDGGFTDQTGTEWYAGEVGAAVGTGILTGYPDGSFKPNRSVTRAEALLKQFPDADAAGEWAIPWLTRAVQDGLLNGRGAGTLQPEAYNTRAEAALLVERMLQLAGYAS
ncbi:S-layer homology domain-containing protein [Cohnella hongkongensis]|uniref:S-layer homology domain-containing protein n=1 Tax=Cohnella hongkongensis TaxID=178337 RepID=A0ABV9F9Z1_9BACL